MEIWRVRDVFEGLECINNKEMVGWVHLKPTHAKMLRFKKKPLILARHGQSRQDTDTNPWPYVEPNKTLSKGSQRAAIHD